MLKEWLLYALAEREREERERERGKRRERVKEAGSKEDVDYKIC